MIVLVPFLCVTGSLSFFYDDDLCSHYIYIDNEEKRKDIAAPVVLPVSSHGGKNSMNGEKLSYT